MNIWIKQELGMLNTMAHGSGLSQTDTHNAKKWAQTYILEHAISYINQSAYGNLHASRTQILTIASNIGLSEQDALTIEAKSDDDNQFSRLDKTYPLFFERDVQLQKQGDSYADITDWILSLQQYPCCIWNSSRRFGTIY